MLPFSNTPPVEIFSTGGGLVHQTVVSAIYAEAGCESSAPACLVCGYARQEQRFTLAGFSQISPVFKQKTVCENCSEAPEQCPFRMALKCP